MDVALGWPDRQHNRTPEMVFFDGIADIDKLSAEKTRIWWIFAAIWRTLPAGRPMNETLNVALAATSSMYCLKFRISLIPYSTSFHDGRLSKMASSLT